MVDLYEKDRIMTYIIGKLKPFFAYGMHVCRSMKEDIKRVFLVFRTDVRKHERERENMKNCMYKFRDSKMKKMSGTKTEAPFLPMSSISFNSINLFKVYGMLQIYKMNMLKKKKI